MEAAGMLCYDRSVYAGPLVFRKTCSVVWNQGRVVAARRSMRVALGRSTYPSCCKRSTTCFGVLLLTWPFPGWLAHDRTRPRLLVLATLARKAASRCFGMCSATSRHSVQLATGSGRSGLVRSAWRTSPRAIEADSRRDAAVVAQPTGVAAEPGAELDDGAPSEELCECVGQADVEHVRMLCQVPTPPSERAGRFSS
eukprot:scaffold82078_cov66-Phaeocystis_antarctica.AAC.2